MNTREWRPPIALFDLLSATQGLRVERLGRPTIPILSLKIDAVA
jgi:hypothetical protein